MINYKAGLIFYAGLIAQRNNEYAKATERFLKAIGKVKQPFINAPKIQEPKPTLSSTSIFVKSDKKIIKVKLDDILYVEAYGNYIKIHTNNVILVPETLSHFLEKLPNQFIRIHKSFSIVSSTDRYLFPNIIRAMKKP